MRWDHGSQLMKFSAIWKFTWSCHYVHPFPNQILIEKKFALEFRKTNTYGSAFICSIIMLAWTLTKTDLTKWAEIIVNYWLNFQSFRSSRDLITVFIFFLMKFSLRKSLHWNSKKQIHDHHTDINASWNRRLKQWLA